MSIATGTNELLMGGSMHSIASWITRPMTYTYSFTKYIHCKGITKKVKIIAISKHAYLHKRVLDKRGQYIATTIIIHTHIHMHTNTE